ncbi:inactive poly [ADP-ribose] polymerase RCD1-like [Nymphaea colorata]|nr:inactive poly [ADP-ribose] polymerase RCD1-like [Nymphaea colorata]
MVKGEVSHGGSGSAELKRKRAEKCALYLTRLRRSHSGLKRQWSSPVASVVCHGRWCICRSGKFLTNNYMNFHKSGLPRRIMFFSQGEWRDFPAHVTGPLANAFFSKTSALVVVLDGRPCLVDFSGMILLDLRSGLAQSIAWIDESERCFFPMFTFDCSEYRKTEYENENRGNGENMKVADRPTLEAEFKSAVNGTDRSKTADENHVRVSYTRVVTIQQGGKNGGFDRPSSLRDGAPLYPGSGALRDTVQALDRGSSDYIRVRNIFLIGMGTLVTAADIVGIYRYSPTCILAQKRVKLFEDSIQFVKGYRGDANVRYAWYGSGIEGILEVMLHGFGRIRKPANGVAYGSRVYLSPYECSHISSSYSDVDEIGMPHMVLCRVIMGNMEKTPFGSEQFHPSSERFDSGVDDLSNPKHYVVWGTDMNIHILPDYVLSFKIPPVAQVFLKYSETRTELKGRHSKIGSATVTDSQPPDVQSKSSYVLIWPHMDNSSPTFSEWPAKYTDKSPGDGVESKFHYAKKQLDYYVGEFEEKRLTREDVVKKFRLIVGDGLLMNILQKWQKLEGNRTRQMLFWKL